MSQQESVVGLAPAALEEARRYRQQGGFRVEVVDYLRRCGCEPAEAEHLADRFDLELGMSGEPRPHDVNPTVAKQLDAHWALLAATAAVPDAPEPNPANQPAVPEAADIARAAIERHATGVPVIANDAPDQIAHPTPGGDQYEVEGYYAATADAPVDPAAWSTPNPYADPAADLDDPGATWPADETVTMLPTFESVEPIAAALVESQNELAFHARTVIDSTQHELVDQARSVIDAAQSTIAGHARAVIEETRSELAGHVRESIEEIENAPIARTTSLSAAMATKSGEHPVVSPSNGDASAEATARISTPSYAAVPEPSNPGPQSDGDWQETTDYGYRIAPTEEDDDPSHAINEASTLAREGKTYEDIVEHLVACNVSPGEAEYVAQMTGARRRPKEDESTKKRRPGSGRRVALVLMMFVAGAIAMYVGWTAYSDGVDSGRSPLSLVAVGAALVLNGVRSLISLRRS